ncbi:putative alpha,alpha-trehalose-phosphate synthase [UDP-forming] 10 [Platanthera guangdongensis]|uniref:Alpha,alpha-trehalose-phosphate synthase [UDP-forming] 10 n=1 Tax=Platanthera guangdongensis TaxID=2320717 RepID=A0ABR2M249_9ASPA
MSFSIQRSMHRDNDDDSDSSTSASLQRIVVVANFLPLHSSKDQQTGKWCFTRDEDSLLLQIKDGLSPETEIMYVGSLKVEIDINEQEEVAHNLFNDYSCVPTFLPLDILKSFYHGFCKKHLWPLFHSMLPICFSNGHPFHQSLFQAYVSANRIFADRVIEAINSHDDYVWVHDYHLMLLPTFLRKKMNQVKLGFFLHSPFPSWEIYRSLPVREHILRGFLNSDLIGFHTFDYARHFLSCCNRMLGLNYQSKCGYIEIEYAGRTIDDMDIFKGINLKLLSLEVLFNGYPSLVGKVVLVQIVNTVRSSGKDADDVRTEAMSLAQRINLLYGAQGYNPVALIDHSIPFHEKIAFYAAADCCIVNAVKDGMNLVPYEYVICRQGTDEMDKLRKICCGSPRTSALIVSEFVGCSSSLSGAFRINPWSVEDVADALRKAICMGEYEKQLRHRKNYDWLLLFCLVSRSFRLAMWSHLTRGAPGGQSSWITMGQSRQMHFGRGRDSLAEWFLACNSLGIAAEHGYFTRGTCGGVAVRHSWNQGECARRTVEGDERSVCASTTNRSDADLGTVGISNRSRRVGKAREQSRGCRIATAETGGGDLNWDNTLRGLRRRCQWCKLQGEILEEMVGRHELRRVLKLLWSSVLVTIALVEFAVEKVEVAS